MWWPLKIIFSPYPKTLRLGVLRSEWSLSQLWRGQGDIPTRGAVGSAWARSEWNQEEEGRLGCFCECSGFPFSSELFSGNGRGLGSAEGRSGLAAARFLGEKGQPRVGSDHWCSPWAVGVWVGTWTWPTRGTC